MKKALAVIGANYGDEGKGLLTDYLARQGADIVVRFNGGANAGHTVQTDGSPQQRHVFHTFGSGTLAGVPTLLSHDFIVNPLLVMDEWKALAATGFKIGRSSFPAVFVDANCAVTTHFDMLLNQFSERCRGASRHGSVGVGIYETMVRNSAGPYFGFTIRDTLSMSGDELRSRLARIRSEFVSARLMSYDMKLPPERIKELMQHVNNPDLDTAFIQALRAFCDQCVFVQSGEFLKDFDTVVFEGAQGLGLDQNYQPGFPHLTRSNTGLKNVLKLLPEDCALEAHYVTRTYLTRHGAGPLVDELPGPPVPGMVDPTNVPHEFQGTLRYAPLDLPGMRDRIVDDFMLMMDDKLKGPMQPFLVMTCLDQTEGLIDPEEVAHFCRIPLRYTSAGPTAATVHGYNAAHAAVATS